MSLMFKGEVSILIINFVSKWRLFSSKLDDKVEVIIIIKEIKYKLTNIKELILILFLLC